MKSVFPFSLKTRSGICQEQDILCDIIWQKMYLYFNMKKTANKMKVLSKIFLKNLPLPLVDDGKDREL